MAKKNKAKGTAELDPVQVTILPIADELLAFTKSMPPDLETWTNRRFEDVFAQLDIKLVRLWLDQAGLSDAARNFDDTLNQFLIRFREWENQTRRAGIIRKEQLLELQMKDDVLFWQLKEELDELFTDAESLARWLQKLARIIREKRGVTQETKPKADIPTLDEDEQDTE